MNDNCHKINVHFLEKKKRFSNTKGFTKDWRFSNIKDSRSPIAESRSSNIKYLKFPNTRHRQKIPKHKTQAEDSQT